MASADDAEDREQLARERDAALRDAAELRRELDAARDTIARLKSELREAQSGARDGATGPGAENGVRARSEADEYRQARQRRRRGRS